MANGRGKSLKAVSTMREFIANWDEKIGKIITSHGLQDMMDDIKQDIYMEMVTPSYRTGLDEVDVQLEELDRSSEEWKRRLSALIPGTPECPNTGFGKTGLERYDPSRGAFSTYVYGLVLVKVRNARTKRIRELGLMPYSHDAVDDNPQFEGSNFKDKTEAHSLELSNNHSNAARLEFMLQLRNVREALKSYPVRSYFFKKGECVTRDLITLLDLVLAGKSREEIVEYFDYSTGSVGVMFDQLRQVPELIELREMLDF